MRIKLIRHPGASLIIPFIDRDRVIMLRQYRPAVKQYLYELPAGTREKGESELACARREIVEETGFAAGSLKKIASIFPVPAYCTEKIAIFRAARLSRKKGSLDKDEIITSKVMTRAQVCRLFRQGLIHDAKTICALAFCGWL
jgi:ADP-ribose pyrophosphatase